MSLFPDPNCLRVDLCFSGRSKGIRYRLIAALTGRLAQLEERLVYTQKVGGSIPSPPTTRLRFSVDQISGGLSPRARATTSSGKGEPSIAVLFTFQDKLILGCSPV